MCSTAYMKARNGNNKNRNPKKTDRPRAEEK